MLLAFRLSTRIRLLLKLDSVAVYANNNRGFTDRSSWKEKRPRERYFPGSEELGDISVLYSNNAVAASSSNLLRVCNKHINSYVEGRNLSEAQSLFNLMIKRELEPDVYTYNILMKGYSRVGNTKRVCELFEEMEEKGIRPTVVTFNTSIRSYASDGDLEGARSFFMKMKNTDGLNPDVYTYNSMLKVCVTARDLDSAENTLLEMNSLGIKQSKVTMNTMLDVYAECSNEDNGIQFLEECRELIEDMESKGIKADKETYSTLLKLCARGSLTTEAMKILKEMKGNHLHPNIYSYSTVLDGISRDHNLSNQEVLTLSSKIVDEMRKAEIRLNAMSYTSLINIALRVGDLHSAKRLFNTMKTLKVEPTLVTYGTMIKCYEKLGDPSDGEAYLKPCLDLLEECEQAGMNMELEGYISMLSACGKASNLDRALKIWSRMMKKKVKPNTSVFNAMINVCLSKDNEDKAFEFLSKMKACKIVPNDITYGTFLSYFVKKKDRTGAKRIRDGMQFHGMMPNRAISSMLKALKID